MAESGVIQREVEELRWFLRRLICFTTVMKNCALMIVTMIVLLHFLPIWWSLRFEFNNTFIIIMKMWYQGSHKCCGGSNSRNTL